MTRSPLALVLALAVVPACAGAPRRETAHWDDTPPPSTSSTDAGVDAADSGADGATVAPGLALFQRSCTPCHTRSGSHDPYAVRSNVFLETDDDFRRWAASESIGNTQSSLAEILALRADGLDLVVGNHLPMPPTSSSYPPFTPEEARTALTWLRSPH
jgi:hypothetical protein